MSAVAPARACAYRVVRRVFEEGAYADLALRSEARKLDTRDRALAMRLAYGAIQWRGTLDHLIAQLAERPAERLDAPLLAALRLGLYELWYLEGAPDHAVVADVVELAKGGVGSRLGGVDSRRSALDSRRGAARASGRHVPVARRVPAARRGGHGLVNAVLRRGAREGRGLLAALDDATPQHAAIKHSHPEWIARMWWEELGPVDARALMAFDNEPAELALRANTLVSDAAKLGSELQAEISQGAGTPTEQAGIGSEGASRTRFRGDPVIPEAVVVEGPFDVYGSPQWRAGALIAQSRAAMLPARILGPRPGERVLDLCAAPGGKTTHLAALMEDRGEVVALERDPRRAGELQRTAQRLHAGCARVIVADARQALTIEGGFEGGFDRVLVDPPCSGLGTLQARADLRWRATPERMRELTGVQRAILASGAAAVRPGGVLVYSTCTISSAENERQIFDLLESNPRFVLDDLRDEPALGAPGTAHRVGRPMMDGRAVLTLPHRDHTAGFFIARLRREAD